MQTQEEFFLANATDGVLTDAQTMQMMNLPEGDTAQAESSKAPDAAANQDDNVPSVDPSPAIEPAPEAVKPVVLAKDGVHTIPFETLEQAREGEKHWKLVAEQAQQKLDALQTQPAAVETPATQPAEPIKADFGDFSEDAIAAGVEKLVDARVAAIVESKVAAALAIPAQQQQAVSEADAHFGSINAKHPDVESVVPSQEFAAWVASQPSYARPAIQAAIEQGTAEQVIDVLDAYKAATGMTPTPAPEVVPDPAVAARAKAAAVIARAQAAVPTSLSEIPAASVVHHDQGEATAEMSGAGLMELFGNKSPEQIRALLERSL